MKIYKIRLALGRITNNGFKIEEIECNEKEKTFVTISNNMVKKTAFMVVDSMFQQGLCHHQSYFTYCHKHEIDKAKLLLYNHVKKNIEKLQVDLSDTKAKLEGLNLTPKRHLAN